MSRITPGERLVLPSGRQVEVLRVFPANGYDADDRLECGYLGPFGNVLHEGRDRVNRVTVTRTFLEKHGRTA